MARISMLIIMMIVFIMVFVGGFGVFMAGVNENYNITGYNQSKIDIYNKLTHISDDAEDIRNKTTQLQSRSGVSDVLGGFLESSYDALKIMGNSFTIFYDMANQGLDDAPFENTNIIRAGVITIVIVIIFVVIILGAVIKHPI